MNLTDIYDREDLFERLTDGVLDQEKRVVFVLGSAVSYQPRDGDFTGVPNVQRIIEIIRSRFEEGQARAFEHHLAKGENPYQTAFKFLLGRRGPEATNGLIKSAVAEARKSVVAENAADSFQFSPKMSDELCRSFESDVSGWKIPPAIDAVARLATADSEKFGRLIITTNFDPLLSVAIHKHGGNHFRSFYHRDGNISQASGPGTHIAHLHGYWYGSDTLHTPKQLKQDRPQLRSSLSQIFRENVVVFIGYGGWDDAITGALSDVIKDDSAFPEIIWTFFDDEPAPRQQLVELLAPGIDRGRVNIYAGIDCHEFLPAIANHMAGDEISASAYEEAIDAKDEEHRPSPPPKSVRHILTIEDDHPPTSDVFVGRGEDLAELQTGDYRAAFITGIGGQGKSILAAHYFESSIEDGRFDHQIWRDCREQGAPFQDQLLSLVEALNDGRVSSAEIAQQTDESLAELFCQLTEDLKLLVVFDNIDHFVDLEDLKLLGTAKIFLDVFLNSKSSAKIIFTCRPSVGYDSESVISMRLPGLTLEAAEQLFLARDATVTPESLLAAHEETKGHPFWLDLLAAQIAERSPKVRIEDLLGGKSDELGSIPDQTLRSIWSGLDTGEQIALQALAEAVRPTPTLELADYVGSNLRLRQLERSIAKLRKLNLVVVKREDEKDFFELHPVIRAFIRNTFKREQREPFIEAIIAVYDALVAPFINENATNYDKDSFQRWMETIELLLNAGKYTEAVEKLDHVSYRFRTREAPHEFLRLCGRLFAGHDFDLLVKQPRFESLFDTYVDLLTNLGRTQDAAEALEDYSETLEGKGARYIHYCDMQTYLHWRSEDYAIAIKWGQRGVDLKESTGVDTSFDSAHNLALARRDSGAVEPALKYFLQKTKLKDVIENEDIEEDRGEEFYGNIGRCLHLMGQIDNSLVCYKKSGRVLDAAGRDSSVENEAFLRQWVGELLYAKGEKQNASDALLAAWAKWKIVSPPKARRLEYRVKNQMDIDIDFDIERFEIAEKSFRRWVRVG